MNFSGYIIIEEKSFILYYTLNFLNTLNLKNLLTTVEHFQSIASIILMMMMMMIYIFSSTSNYLQDLNQPRIFTMIIITKK